MQSHSVGECVPCSVEGIWCEEGGGIVWEGEAGTGPDNARTTSESPCAPLSDWSDSLPLLLFPLLLLQSESVPVLCPSVMYRAIAFFRLSCKGIVWRRDRVVSKLFRRSKLLACCFVNLDSSASNVFFCPLNVSCRFIMVAKMPSMETWYCARHVRYDLIDSPINEDICSPI